MPRTIQTLWRQHAHWQTLWTPWAMDALAVALRLMLADVFLRSGWGMC